MFVKIYLFLPYQRLNKLIFFCIKLCKLWDDCFLNLTSCNLVKILNFLPLGSNLFHKHSNLLRILMIISIQAVHDLILFLIDVIYYFLHLPWDPLLIFFSCTVSWCNITTQLLVNHIQNLTFWIQTNRPLL